MSSERTPFQALDAYQSGDMPDAEATGFEEELFSAAASGAGVTLEEAEFIDRVSLIGQYLAPRGGWDFGSSRARVDALIAAGLRVQVIDPQPGQPFQVPKIDDDAEIVATHIAIDVRGYDSVRVLVEKPDGTELKVFRDIGFDPTDGTVYAVCEAPLARISARQTQLRSHVIGTRAGRDHVIAVFETVADP